MPDVIGIQFFLDSGVRRNDAFGSILWLDEQNPPSVNNNLNLFIFFATQRKRTKRKGALRCG